MNGTNTKMETAQRSADSARRFRRHTARCQRAGVYGQWIIGVDDDDFDVKCSKREWTDIFEVAGIAAVERIAKTMHYCLNCGAKMDGAE